MLLKYINMSSIVPNIAYPSTNKNTNSLVAPLWRKPGPIKHYRKQLQPQRYSNNNRTTINRINAPGGSIYKNSYTCSDDASIQIIKTNINQGLDPCLGVYNLEKYSTCVGGTMNINRSGSAEFNQKVYNSTQEYLQSRCITSEQKNGTYRGMFKTFTSELYESPHCSKRHAHIVYKPSNRKYGTQGSVDSSSRMARLKYATQTRNGAYFMNARGAKKINNGAYNSSGINTNILSNKPVCDSSITNKIRTKSLAHDNCIVNEKNDVTLPNLETYDITPGTNTLCHISNGLNTNKKEFSYNSGGFVRENYNVTITNDYTIEELETTTITTDTTTSVTSTIVTETETTTTEETTVETSTATLTITTPILFETILTQSYTPTLSSISSISSLSKVLIYCDETTYMNISSTYDIDFTTESEMTTYNDILSCTFNIVQDPTYSSYYRIDSELHSVYSLDYDSTDGLVFRNVWGYDRDSDSGYLLFEIDTTNEYLIAHKRFVYDSSSSTYYSEDTSFTTSYYVVYSSEAFTMTSTETVSNILFYEDSGLDLNIPNAFNPASTDYAVDTNDDVLPRVVWSSTIGSYAQHNLYDSGTNSKIYKDMNSDYQSQVITSGNDSDTSSAASTMLSAIQEAVESEGNSLQYDSSVYIAFRNGLLNTTLQCNTIVNGEVGQTTAPYVYFTNETDDDGIYHPFMVIASHSIADKPNQLVDVATPPGDGTTNYIEGSVTRDATLGTFLYKIPMKNYGYVSDVTDNTMLNSLYADVTSTPSEATVYNWASISAIGVAIDGVSIYPILNNTLTPASEKSEITRTGIHVGQGMQLHYHADGHSATGNGLNLYNLTDYVDASHPPLIGFGFDGIALYGKYETSYSSMDGYDTDLDEFGGHSHDSYGYHYHSHDIENAISTIGDNAGSTSGVSEYTYHALMKGAWYGLINDIPEFWNSSSLAPNISFAQVNRYVGNSS